MLQYIIFYAAAALYILSCGTPPSTGGSSDSGNVKFAGVLHTVSGGRASGAVVILCTDAWADDSASGENTVIRRVTADDSGRFLFDSIDAGDYCIEGNDQVANAVLLRLNVASVDSGELFRDDTLRPYAAIEGSVGRSPSTASERYLMVRGLDRIIKVDADGGFKIDNLPAGTFKFRIVNADTALPPAEINGVSIESGKTLSVPYFGWLHQTRIFLNTTASGADIQDDVTGFPVLVRLNADNFNFSEAGADGADIRFTKADNAPMPFEIERWDAVRQRGEIWVKTDTVYGNNSSQYFNMIWGNTAKVLPETGRGVFDTTGGFQAVWHLADTTVGLVLDATENAFNGTPAAMTSASIIDGIIGRARAFDGIAASIRIGNSAKGKLDFPQGGPYSLSAWVYARTLDSSSRVVISKGDEQYFLCSVKGFAATPLWQLVEFRDHAGWQSCKGSAKEGQWVYLAGVQNGTSQQLYVNGELVDSTHSLLASVRSRITDFDVAIGMFMETGSEGGNGYFDGNIDEVRIYDKPSSAGWVRLCYMNQRVGDRLVTMKP